MAVTEDMDFPRLTPSDGRLPSGSRLFRGPEELTDEQFDLLSAAWADDALEGEALTELESVITADNRRRLRAESFHRLRLVAGSEPWPGMRSCLRPEPGRVSFRRTIMPALMAAAAMLALIIAGPASGRLHSKESSGVATSPEAMAVAEIQASHPIVVTDNRPDAAEIQPSHPIMVTDSRPDAAEIPASHPIITAEGRAGADGNRPAADNRRDEAARAIHLALVYQEAALSSLLPVQSNQMAPVRLTDITPVYTLPQEKNWMLRGITMIASAVTGKEKEIDGYAIASSCVSGINNLLGWEMELEKVSNKAGDPVAVNFSSSLLSFTKPMNKITP
ncbi:MAG: hypothetical protein GX622_10840 [Bacteroidales bacterium]|nr:hypothetical protein [Bacteroidales bacterium]